MKVCLPSTLNAPRLAAGPSKAVHYFFAAEFNVAQQSAWVYCKRTLKQRRNRVHSRLLYHVFVFTIPIMTLDTLIMLAGAFVALLPFLGFPNSWDTVLFFIAGIFIVALGILVRMRMSKNDTTASRPLVDTSPRQPHDAP